MRKLTAFAAVSALALGKTATAWQIPRPTILFQRCGAQLPVASGHVSSGTATLPVCHVADVVGNCGWFRTANRKSGLK